MTEQYGWVWEPEHKHLCSPPTDLRDHFEGALWRCAECDQYWEVYADQDTAMRKKMRLVSPVTAALRMGTDPGLLTNVPGLEGRSEFATGG
jgi:hypothetical protein